MDTFRFFCKVPVQTLNGEEFITFTHNRSRERINQHHGPFWSYAYELYVHIEGTCNILIGDRIFSPKCGDLFLYRTNQPHHLITKSDVYERFVLFFSPHVFDSIVCEPPILDLFESREASGNQVVLPGDSSQEIMKRLRRVSQTIQSDAADAPYLVYCDSLRVLLAVKRLLAHSSSVPLGMNCPKILGEIIDYLHANYQSIQGLQEVYKHFGISRAYLSRIFTNYTVVTPYNYLRDLKLSAAKELLASGASVTEACFESGFTDYSNFIRLFRTRTGMTPLSYKRKLTQSE